MSEENYTSFERRLLPVLTPREHDLVMRAYIFAKYGHYEQTRDDGSTPYYYHTRSVALILIDELGIYDPEIIEDSLLHDIREGSRLLTPQAILDNFGRNVMIGINLLTKEGEVDEYLERLVRQGSWKVLIVKLADRLHNVRTLHNCKDEKVRRKIRETVDKYFPLIDVLRGKLPKGRGIYADLLEQKLKEALGRYEFYREITS